MCGVVCVFELLLVCASVRFVRKFVICCVLVCCCVCVRGLGGSMCLCALYVNYCVRFYGVFCSWC